MSRAVLPVLAVLFALPAGAMIWKGQDFAQVFPLIQVFKQVGADYKIQLVLGMP